MKNSFFPLALALCLSLAACDSAPNRTNQKTDSNDAQSESPSAAVKKYRFNSAVDQCDTYTRTFQTQL